MGKKSNRQQALDAIQAQDNTDVEEQVLPCQDPVLTELEVVSGALYRQGDRWWTTVQQVEPAVVKATTKPDTPGTWATITWAGDGTQGVRGDLRGVSRQTVTTINAPRVVAATLNSPRMEQRVDVWNLVQLGCDLPIHVGGTVWKGYVGHIPGDTATITATTDPAHADVWAKLQWNPDSTQGNPNQRRYTVSTAGDRVVDVVLGKPTIGEIRKKATLHICEWPRLQIKWEQFDGLQVLNDGATHIDVGFDRRWEEGRPDPKPGILAGKDTDEVQSPLCWAAGATIRVQAGFRVTRKSTDDETVAIEGRATIDGVNMIWAATVQVRSTDKVGDEVTIAQVTASASLPASKVQYADACRIEWFMKDADNATWISCGRTEHLLYVTLAAPTKTLYWTLLDISCRGAKGSMTPDTVVDTAFALFRGQTGNARGFKRLGDGVTMRYYGEGANTAQGADVQSPRGILRNATGSGRCGGWARLMAHMMALHGIDVLLYTMDCDALPANTILHVRNFTHNGVGTCSRMPYTHRGSECSKADGLPGQGKTNPQFLFGDHAAVYYNNQIYDPSYGVGPEPDRARYERDAVAGLGSLGSAGTDYTAFNSGDGTPQVKANRCCEGFFIQAMPAVGTLDTVAAPFGKTGNQLWNHPYNRGIKAAGVNPPPAGTTLYIPRGWAPNRLMLAHGTQAP
jgi:hypothetical protein